MMKLPGLLYEKLWLPYEYKKNNFNILKILHLLNKSQYWYREQIEKYQILKIRELLKKAAENSKYYKALYKYIDIDRVKLEDIKTLPLLNKANIREQYNDFLTSKNLKSFLHETSGSTGIPLKVYLNPCAEAFRRACHLRFHSWWDIRPGDRNALIWGRKATAKPNGVLKQFKNNLVDRTYVINVFDLNLNTVGRFFNEMVRFKPVYLRGYVSAIVQFAYLIREKKFPVSKLNFKVIITTSEILFPHYRTYIEETFNCKVANEYGAADGGIFACECPGGGMHLQEESIFGWTTTNNEWIVTEFQNKLMPMINYQIGDNITISEKQCNCGRSLRLLTKIEGRVGDMIRKPNGELLSQYIFYYIVEELENLGLGDSIQQYRVIQNNNEFKFYFIKGNNFSVQAIDYIRNQMYKRIDPEISIIFRNVNFFEKEESGKLRFFKRR